MRTACLCLALLAVAPAPSPAARAAARLGVRPADDDFRARFDKMDERINDGRGYSESSNANGILAWGEGYVMQGYAEMYRATGDTGYLDRIVEHFDRVLANRDTDRKLPDAFRHVPLPAWGSNEFSQGQWHVWAVHTGMICLGPADFITVVKGENRLRHRYAAKFDEYLACIKEAVAAHASEWRNGPGPSEGYYYDPAVGALPLNQQNGLGLVELQLYLVTRDHLYRDHVARLAQYFKNRVHSTPDGAYDWSYWPQPFSNGKGSEDISHAAINIEFAVRCRAAHIVFNDSDMNAFARTWNNHVRRAAGEWADTVGGGGGTNTYVPQAVGRWMDLSDYDGQLYQDARQAFMSVDEEHASAANMLGLAKLAVREHELKQKKGWRLPHIRLWPRRAH